MNSGGSGWHLDRWWEQHAALVADLPTTKSLMTVRRTLLESFITSFSDLAYADGQVSHDMPQPARSLQARGHGRRARETAGRSCRVTVSAEVQASECGHPRQRSRV